MTRPLSTRVRALTTAGSLSTAEGGEGGGGPVAPKGLQSVVVHPLVLLSVTDHYNRVRTLAHADMTRRTPRPRRCMLNAIAMRAGG